MRKQEKPRDERAKAEHPEQSGTEISLVDYFDQMDRAAFHRALEFRDSFYVAAHPGK